MLAGRPGTPDNQGTRPVAPPSIKEAHRAAINSRPGAPVVDESRARAAALFFRLGIRWEGNSALEPPRR